VLKVQHVTKVFSRCSIVQDVTTGLQKCAHAAKVDPSPRLLTGLLWDVQGDNESHLLSYLALDKCVPVDKLTGHYQRLYPQVTAILRIQDIEKKVRNLLNTTSRHVAMRLINLRPVSSVLPVRLPVGLTLACDLLSQSASLFIDLLRILLSDGDMEGPFSYVSMVTTFLTSPTVIICSCLKPRPTSRLLDTKKRLLLPR
jgi:hypothetical protein